MAASLYMWPQEVGGGGGAVVTTAGDHGAPDSGSACAEPVFWTAAGWDVTPFPDALAVIAVATMGRAVVTVVFAPHRTFMGRTDPALFHGER